MMDENKERNWQELMDALIEWSPTSGLRYKISLDNDPSKITIEKIEVEQQEILGTSPIEMDNGNRIEVSPTPRTLDDGDTWY